MLPDGVSMTRRKTATPPETFDEPWKQIVPALFQPFLEFFAPEVAREIDWSRKPVFLDKELRRIAKGFGRRRRSTADFLVKVWRLDGAEQWLIIHIELQAQKDVNFAERMFLYNVRAYDLYRKPVISLAVLADSDPKWRPAGFEYGLGGSGTSIRYPAVKLLDYQERQEELEADPNPFGLAVLAHLKTQETRDNAENRLQWKVRLARLLFVRRWTREQIEELLQFLDWIMTLPEALENSFEARYTEMEKVETMAETMSPIIRRAQARGIEIGKKEALIEAQSLLLRLAAKRLGLPSEASRARVEAIQVKSRLDFLCERVFDVETWEELLEGEA